MEVKEDEKIREKETSSRDGAEKLLKLPLLAPRAANLPSNLLSSHPLGSGLLS